MQDRKVQAFEFPGQLQSEQNRFLIPNLPNVGNYSSVVRVCSVCVFPIFTFLLCPLIRIVFPETPQIKPNILMSLVAGVGAEPLLGSARPWEGIWARTCLP